MTQLVPLLQSSMHEGASMDAALQTQLTIAALVCSALALFFSLLAAFPGLKAVLAAFRDGVLWFALFLVLGGVGVRRLAASPEAAEAGAPWGRLPACPECAAVGRRYCPIAVRGNSIAGLRPARVPAPRAPRTFRPPACHRSSFAGLRAYT